MPNNDVVIKVSAKDSTKAGFDQTNRNIKGVRTSVDGLSDDVRALGKLRAEPKVEMDAGDVDKAIAATRRQLESLARTSTDVKVQAETREALADLDKLEAAARKLAADKIDPKVTIDGDKAKADLDKIADEVRKLDGKRAKVSVTADTSKAKGEIDGMGSRLSGAAKGAGLAIGAGIGAAAASIIGESIAQSIENADASSALEAKLMGDPGKFRDAGKVAGQLWAGGYGESMDDINTSVFNVIKSGALMKDASVADIQAVTASAMNLSTVWGVDVTESMRAVGQLVRTGLVKDAKEGLGLISQSFSDLGPAGDDAIDTVVEYSTQFRKLGLDGPTAMTLLSQAVQAGARDTDTAADAIKEFAILAVEKGGTAEAGFKALGLSAQDMAGKIAAGGPVAAGALDLTLDRLRDMKDPIAQNAAGVALFGTKWEDMGASILAMDPTPTTTAFRDMGTTIDGVNKVMDDTVTTHVTTMQRGLFGLGSSFGDTAAQTQGALGIITGAMGLWGKVTGDTAQGVANSTDAAGRAMTTNMRGGVEGSLGQVRRLPGEAAGALSGLHGAGSRAGNDLAAGFRGGIMAQIASIANAARELANRAIAAIRSAIAARSPSRKSMELGAYLGQGFQLGMAGVESGVIASATRLSRGALAALTVTAPAMRAAPTTGLAAAAREVMAQRQRGGAVFEDFSFRGNSANLGQFNDDLVDRYRSQGGGDIDSFLARLVGSDTPAQRGPAPAGLTVDFGGNTDGVFASAFMKLVRTGAIQIRVSS